MFATFGIVLMALMAAFFRIEHTTRAGFMQTADPAYPYLQAVAMHRVSGKPFIYYLSAALKEGNGMVEGVDVAAELEKFGETFELFDSSATEVLSANVPEGPTAREGTIRNAFLAVPPGGYLVMTYEWS